MGCFHLYNNHINRKGLIIHSLNRVSTKKVLTPPYWIDDQASIHPKMSREDTPESVIPRPNIKGLKHRSTQNLKARKLFLDNKEPQLTLIDLQDPLKANMKKLSFELDQFIKATAKNLFKLCCVNDDQIGP